MSFRGSDGRKRAELSVGYGKAVRKATCCIKWNQFGIVCTVELVGHWSVSGHSQDTAVKAHEWRCGNSEKSPLGTRDTVQAQHQTRLRIVGFRSKSVEACF